MSELIFKKNLLNGPAFLKHIERLPHSFAIITDTTLEKLFASKLQEFLKRNGVKSYLFSLPPGEKNKTRESKAALEDKMLEKKLGRDSAVIGVGGGMICDLAGFVAATYCRGVPFLSIPTSLLAMVDACIGGKVGVNTSKGKNLIGAYYPAHSIFIDTDHLSTLPPLEFQNGMAEIIKYALIGSPKLFKALKKEINDDSLAFFIKESCAIKKEIVTKDPFETGLRRILNFGHTVGHALELATSYSLPHGQAVAIGMATEARLSNRLGHLKDKDLTNILQLLEEYDFQLAFPASFDEKKFFEALKMDKKAVGSKPRFVLLEAIGKVKAFEDAYCQPVAPKMLKEVLKGQ